MSIEIICNGSEQHEECSQPADVAHCDRCYKEIITAVKEEAYTDGYNTAEKEGKIAEDDAYEAGKEEGIRLTEEKNNH